jgi:hypothetical protein
MPREPIAPLSSLTGSQLEHRVNDARLLRFREASVEREPYEPIAH